MAYSNVKLPRLPVNWRTQPQLFERYWDEAMTTIENNLNAILGLPAIQAAIDAAAAAAATANTAATAANTAATNAQATSDAADLENSLINSFVDASSFTAPLLTATVALAVTIKTHTRIYGKPSLNPNRSVTGATITATGAVAGDTVRIYYSDPTRVGGAVTYLFTIDPAPAPVQGVNIHSVGAVMIPAAGTNNGKFAQPPGYVTL